MEFEVFKDGRQCGTREIPDNILKEAQSVHRFMCNTDITLLHGLSLASSLTPAQQHAEELATALNNCARMLSDNNRAAIDAFALLDKIKPPEPPTLAEALDLLQRYEASGDDAWMLDDTRAMLDRARRSGVL